MTKGAELAGARPALGETGLGGTTVQARNVDLGVEEQPHSTRSSPRKDQRVWVSGVTGARHEPGARANQDTWLLTRPTGADRV